MTQYVEWSGQNSPKSIDPHNPPPQVEVYSADRDLWVTRSWAQSLVKECRYRIDADLLAPHPGEFWLDDEGDTLRIVGPSFYGEIYTEAKNGDVYSVERSNLVKPLLGRTEFEESPPELPAGYEHFDPPKYQRLNPGDLYLSLTGGDSVFRADLLDSLEATTPRWIVRRKKRTIILKRWLYKHQRGWSESEWHENLDGIVHTEAIELDSKEIEVPS